MVKKGKNGRPLCPCLASKHGLVANCLNCGKIICKLEGPGPCPFCGEEVIDGDQQVRVYQQRQRELIHENKVREIKSSGAMVPIVKGMGGVNVNTDDRGESSSSTSHSPISFDMANSLDTPTAGSSSASTTSKGKGKGKGKESTSSSTHSNHPTQEQIIQQRNEKIAVKLEVQAEMEQKNAALAKAQAAKAQLLDFDRNSAERTKVFDTATDFDPNVSMANNKW